YIQKYPDTTGQFTRLAYYWLALDYFNAKNYEEAVKRGEERLKMGNFGQGEEARMTLMLGNSYAIKGAPIFDKEKAMQYIEKAMSLGEKANDKDVVKTAQELKKSLSGPVAPPPPNLTPEQKIKHLYSQDQYDEAIAYYKTLGESDKNNPEIQKTYGNALFKADQVDAALKEFQGLYAKDKKAAYALRIGEIYAMKAEKSKVYSDSAVNYFLEAGLLSQKENNPANVKAAFGNAEYQLCEKYDYNKKVKEFDATQKKGATSAQKNLAAIKTKERELRKLKKKIRDEYESMDMGAPPYLEDQVTKLETEIQTLKAGGSTSDNGELAKLEAEYARIQKELETMKAEAKKRLNL
ncbi:MAG TPA: tetratricopeptide repeat protein, partial [Candidatus Deferrimicrobium sp.]|nr:tetratricopeptide repeat protein [Candidatus Deferrimicrobium sp.]